MTSREMKKKYKLTDETQEAYGCTLHRIVAVRSFLLVKAGDKGGWVKHKGNLSQDGDCWIYDDAMVFDNAVVSGNASVGGNARIFGNAKVYDNARVYGSANIYDHASVYENAYVYNNARVHKNAEVHGKATLYENAMVQGEANVCGRVKLHGSVELCHDADVSNDGDYIVFKNWWSSGRYFTWTLSNNKWKVGCFYGTGEELIRKAYRDSEMSGREYERIVKYVEEILKEEK